MYYHVPCTTCAFFLWVSHVGVGVRVFVCDVGVVTRFIFRSKTDSKKKKKVVAFLETRAPLVGLKREKKASEGN